MHQFKICRKFKCNQCILFRNIYQTIGFLPSNAGVTSKYTVLAENIWSRDWKYTVFLRKIYGLQKNTSLTIIFRWWPYIFGPWPYIFRTWPYIFKDRILSSLQIAIQWGKFGKSYISIIINILSRPNRFPLAK